MNPLITCMIQADNMQSAIKTARNAAYDGCDAYGFQLEVFSKEQRTDDNMKSIFREMGRKPIYVTSYRSGQNAGMNDDELVDTLAWIESATAFRFGLFSFV